MRWAPTLLRVTARGRRLARPLPHRRGVSHLRGREVRGLVVGGDHQVGGVRAPEGAREELGVAGIALEHRSASGGKVFGLRRAAAQDTNGVALLEQPSEGDGLPDVSGGAGEA